MFRFIIGDTVDGTFFFKNFVLIRSGPREIKGSEGGGIVFVLFLDRYFCHRRHGCCLIDLLQREGKAVIRFPFAAFKDLLHFDLAAAFCGIAVLNRSGNIDGLPAERFGRDRLTVYRHCFR